MAIFLGERGLAGFIRAKDDGGGSGNWSYKSCKAPVKSSPPTNQHPAFRDRMSFLSPVSEHWRESSWLSPWGRKIVNTSSVPIWFDLEALNLTT